MYGNKTFADIPVGLAVLLTTVLSVSLPGVANAQGCFTVVTPPDGKVLGPYSLSSTSADLNLLFKVESGRSYSIEAITAQGNAGAFLAPGVNIHSNQMCPTSDDTASYVVRDTTGITPGVNFGAVRKAVVVLVSQVLSMRLHNGQAAASEVMIAATETTMYSPAWSTNGTYETYYSFQNTTSDVCNITLTLSDPGGTVLATLSGAVPTGATLSTNTRAMATARDRTGTARLAHNCPPGGIQPEAAVANFSIAPTPYFQSVKFAQVHAAH